ncbi:MAG: hypothetical protein H7Z19_11755 [Chitinophagaceae bacterium]|nr:hypothetical protein [Rubrivivax sp.]
MKTHQTLAAIAIAVGALTSAAHAQSLTAPNLAGTPDEGLVCRPGYVPIFNSNKLTCQKTLDLKVALGCNDPRFPNKVVRANAPGTPNGLDVCDKPGGVTITATNDISSFNQGSDYVFAKADDARIAERIANQRQNEASALGLSLAEVDAVFERALTNTTDGDSEDKSGVLYRLYTFAVKTTGGVVAGPSGPSPAVFAPRALPR